MQSLYIRCRIRWSLSWQGIVLQLRTNPSSNYLIGTIQKYDEHPILRFNSRKLRTPEKNMSLSVSINTDDQGVFDTLLENEYELMTLALKKSKDKDNQPCCMILKIFMNGLINVREMGLEQSFKWNAPAVRNNSEKKAANISRSDLVIAKTTKIHYNRISFKKSILAPQTITENIVLEIPVDLSQMSALECNNPCQKVKIDRKNILPQEITLTCGEKCEDDSEGDVNSERRCNFLCSMVLRKKWLFNQGACCIKRIP